MKSCIYCVNAFIRSCSYCGESCSRIYIAGVHAVGLLDVRTTPLILLLLWFDFTCLNSSVYFHANELGYEAGLQRFRLGAINMRKYDGLIDSVRR